MMEAAKTFFIGLFVFILSTVQLILEQNQMRIIGIVIGLFFVFWGWKVGWQKYRGWAALLGHVAITAGCLVTAYGIYQIPFLDHAPTIIEVIDMPLFWGIFVLFGGYCMITHSYCKCAISMNRGKGRSAKNHCGVHYMD